MTLRRFKPTRHVISTLPSGACVSVYADETGQIGLEFQNRDGDRTRCLLSEEASIALAKGLNTLHAGGGQKRPEAQWRLVPNTLAKELTK